MNRAKMRSLLIQLYGQEAGESVFDQLILLLDEYRSRLPRTRRRGLTQRDAILIAYPDQIQEPGKPSLRALAEFCDKYLADAISGLHVLPFYPWSSDDGFSVIDYRAVDERYGTWEHVNAIGQHFRLMLDAVINHVSISSEWFQRMLRGDERYRDYFIVPPEDADLTQVVRPRALPLLTIFSTPSGERKVWTTFSADQADLNYENPAVLLEILEILLFYVSQGAEFVRLDAVPYLWKRPGTSCIHLPQTHWIIQLFRAVLDGIAPHVILITETNVPHAENISYFGDGANEAQLVYNFSLPPLVLHAFQTGSAETLSRWAAGLKLPSNQVTYFNFLASHDGIGLNPLRGILSEAEIASVVQRTQAQGGLVSFNAEQDGARRPYELNINFFDALNNPRADEPMEVQIDRFICAHAILLAMIGVPGIYFHSLVGSRGWPEGVAQTGHNRAINRRKFQKEELEQSLCEPAARQARVLTRLSHLLKIRRRHSAFDPYGSQAVPQCPPEIFGLLRVSRDRKNRVLCLHNLSGHAQTIDAQALRVPGKALNFGRELLTELAIPANEPISMMPFQALWLSD